MAVAEAAKAETSVDQRNEEEVEFVWGRKRGTGGKKKEVQFYESFTYDGVDYALYDCVWMHKEDETPYIGKLIKIWGNPDKSRKIKVHWFFRPSEILYHLKDVTVAENEIFFASGEGTGLANVNSLEAIAGKCNVVCISEDSRNPQPSEEEVKMADYVFYRTFDVGNCTILDKMDDKVGGLDVKYVFNRKESQKASDVSKSASDQKDAKTAVECQATGESSGLKRHNNIETAKASHLIGESDIDAQGSMARQDADTNVLRVNQETKKKGISAPCGHNSQVDSGVAKAAGKSSHLVGKSSVLRVNQETKKKAFSAPCEHNSQVDSGVSEAAGKSSHLVGKSDVDVEGSPVRQGTLLGDTNGSRVEQQSTMKGNYVPVQIANSKAATTVVHKNNASTEENARCKVKNDKGEKTVNKPPSNLVEAGERGKPGLLDDRPSKRIKVNGSVTISEDKGVSSVQKSTVCRNDKKVLGAIAVPLEEIKKSGDSKLSSARDKNMKIRKDSVAPDMKPLKKANLDTHKVKEDRDKSKMSIGKADDNLSKLPKQSPKEVERTEHKSFEVTRRPVVESSKWFKPPPWEEVMQTANEQGTLILVENLHPDYTSGEVEDIIWHACRENCTAKMVQRVAFSNPNCGRALVAFKTREAAERVQKKLDDGCLMLTNQRPLIASFVSLPKTEGNTPSFAGHLCLDRLRLQLLREMKEAVSTSHCSQPNTIEHEMSLEWRLLQARSDNWWKRLYKQQKDDLKKVISELKRK